MSAISDNSTHNSKDKNCFKPLLDNLKQNYPSKYKRTLLIVSIAQQKLYLIDNLQINKSYLISSAELGIGNKSGSHQTPLGIHQISEKFGDSAPIATIFKARKSTHSFADILTKPDEKSDKDNITSRILWLDGLEEDVNKGFDAQGNNIDSHSRYIYIHGTDEEGRLGCTASHGCIRMSNRDVIELFDIVEVGCLVIITKD